MASRCALEAVVLAGRQPQSCCLRDGDAPPFRCVRAAPDIDTNSGVKGVSVLLPLKGLDVTLAVLIGVIDDPRCADFVAFRPSAFAN